MSAPQSFFQRARAGAYRGHSAQTRQQQTDYQPGNQAAPPSSGPNHALNSYSRPRPRNHNLYERSSVPDQQHLQERVRLQHQFLMVTASVALQTALTPAEGQEKDAFRLELENVAQTAVADYVKSSLTPVDPKKVKLKCYGSLASGFAVEGSDLDLLLMFPKDKGPVGSIEADVQRLLEKAFLDSGYGARLLTKTRVPILRVCQKPTSDLLENLRQNRKRWEEEEQTANEVENNLHGLDSNRLPETTNEQLLAASKAFAELELSPTDVPLPPSPVRDHANLEYKGDVGIHCDINFSNYVAIHNTTLLRCYCKCDPRVREMGIFVKAWAKARKINTPYYGTLSSYGYILMVLHYLMNVAKPPVIPNLQHVARDADAWAGRTEIDLFEGFDVRFDNNEQKIEHSAKAGQITENKQSLGALLHGFFWYYSDRQGFRWIDEVISIRTVGGILTKQSKGWTEGKWAGENNQIRLRYLFAIEDPFETEHNIARTVGHSGVVAIRDEFRRAWDIIGKARLTHGGEWQWRKADGTIGEDLLEMAQDRGDLLKKDQEYHRKKQQDVRAAFAAKKAREEAAKAEGVATDGQEPGSEKIAESGMSSASMPNPTLTNEGDFSTDRSNSQLIRNSKTQLTPKRTNGRRRKVKSDGDSSGDEVDQTWPESSLESPGTLSKSTAETISVQECETDIKSSNESEEVASQTADSYCPYIDPDLLNASVPLRLEDVSVRPGSIDDGKPLAWNKNTQPGRWLHWRDRKIRRGDFDPQKHFGGLFTSLHRLFPYDSSRPISTPSRTEQKRNEWLREKRIAYFTGSSAGPGENADPVKTTDSGSNCTGQGLHTSDQPSVKALEQSRKDSAISGITPPGPGETRAPSPKSRKRRAKSGSRKLPVGSGSETRTMTPANTNSVATRESVSAPIQNGIDMSFRPRDEDPNIMPIPPRTGFKFDPRQLRDLAIIKQGGNGCARGGEEWNVEIEGEWGGGGIMGAVKTSSGLISTPMGFSRGYGGGDGWECGRGDEEGLLGELPDFGAIDV
jgi:terminal uridylyltransferase